MNKITTIIDNDSWMLPCMSKQVLGADCPGCGIQRSIAYLIKGEFLNAFFMYPGLYPMIILGIFLVLDFFIEIKYGEKIKLILFIITVSAILINYFLKLI
jgi:hypothetical protein